MFSHNAPMKFIRRNPGFVVGILALIVAMGGTAVAGTLITSRQIKNGTIQVKDISKKALKTLKGKRGPAGVTGLTGATGATGPAATSTRNQSASLNTVVLGNTVTATVNCLAGHILTGGGGSATGTGGMAVLVDSHASSVGDGGTWTVTAVEAAATASTLTATAYAICAP